MKQRTKTTRVKGSNRHLALYVQHKVCGICQKAAGICLCHYNMLSEHTQRLVHSFSHTLQLFGKLSVCSLTATSLSCSSPQQPSPPPPPPPAECVNFTHVVWKIRKGEQWARRPPEREGETRPSQNASVRTSEGRSVFPEPSAWQKRYWGDSGL